MIRNNPPYNGKRYLSNLSTGEIHDMTREKPQCQIEEIKNFIMADTYQNAVIETVFKAYPHKPNGCHYCNLEHDD